LVANGEYDRMVPTSNSRDLAQRLANSELVLYPDAGHGGIFQYHDEFVGSVGVSRAMSSVDVGDDRPVHGARRCGVKT
jgi:pimeloyl-ACP methyl ester carboxylesterase